MKPLKPLYWDVDRWRHEGQRKPDQKPDLRDHPEIEEAAAFSDLLETGLRHETEEAMTAVDFDRLSERILSGVDQLEALNHAETPKEKPAWIASWLRAPALAAACLGLLALAVVSLSGPDSATPGPGAAPVLADQDCTVERIQTPFRNQTLVLQAKDATETTVIWVVEDGDSKLN